MEMTKNFKQMFSDEENRNNIQYGDNTNEVDYVQNDPKNMDTFLNLEDTFIESKKNYGGKMGSNVIVGRKEKHLEIQRFNYATMHIEPNPQDDYAYIVGYSYTYDGAQTPRYVRFPEANNFRKIEIMQDGMYRLMHKEALTLDSSDREFYTYINLSRDNGNIQRSLCVYHIQGNVSKHLGYDDITLTLGEMHPRITGYCSLYSELKKGDILEYRIIGNKTDLNDAHRVDISSQAKPYSNIWQVEYINFPFDTLNKGIKQNLVYLI